jgi:hypothetical protein
MNCFVCNGSATDGPIANGGKLVNCDGCGWYRISGTALHLFHQNLWVFNVTRTREWLRLKREEGHSQPIIESDTNLKD